MYNCESCNKKFSDKDKFLSHMDVCDDDILSVTSDMSYSSRKSGIGYIKNQLEKYKSENKKLSRRIKELDIHYNGIISKIRNEDTKDDYERHKLNLEKIISDLHSNIFDKDQIILKLNRKIETENSNKKIINNDLEYKNIINILEEVIKKLKYKINLIESEKNKIINDNKIFKNNIEKKSKEQINTIIQKYNKDYNNYIKKKDIEIDNISSKHNEEIIKINKQHDKQKISLNLEYKKLLNKNKLDSETYIINNRENDRLTIEKLLIKETLLNKRHEQQLNKLKFENEKTNNNYNKHLTNLNNINKKLENNIKLKIKSIETDKNTIENLTNTINIKTNKILENTEQITKLQNTIEYMSRVIKNKQNEIENVKTITQEYIDKETKLLISTNKINEQKIQLEKTLTEIKSNKNKIIIEKDKIQKELSTIKQEHFKEIIFLKNDIEKINKENNELTINNNLLKSRYIEINKDLDKLKNIRDKYEIQKNNNIENTVILETIKKNNNTLTLNIEDKQKIINSNNVDIKNLNKQKIELESELDNTRKRLQSCETLLNSLVRDKNLLTGRINDLLTKIPR